MCDCIIVQSLVSELFSMMVVHNTKSYVSDNAVFPRIRTHIQFENLIWKNTTGTQSTKPIKSPPQQLSRL